MIQEILKNKELSELDKFRQEMHKIKNTELAKKDKEKGYNTYWENINPDDLDDKDRLMYETCNSEISSEQLLEEFEKYRSERYYLRTKEENKAIRKTYDGKTHSRRLMRKFKKGMSEKNTLKKKINKSQAEFSAWLATEVSNKEPLEEDEN